LRRALFGVVRFPSTVSLPDDIRGGSSNAPNQAASAAFVSVGHDAP
jgi:hypothetical protein